MTFDRIPFIDMDCYGTGRKDRLVREAREICHNVGFFYVRNHGIPQPSCTSYLATTRRFFDLPEEVKRSIHKQYSPHFRGWEQLGSELTNNQVDYREQLDVGTERQAITDPEPYFLRLVGPNQWPPEEALPGFRAIVSDYMNQMESLARRILRLLSASLGLSDDHIEKAFGDDPMPYCKLIRYPLTPEGGAGVGAHKDAGFLALLLQDEASGLQAQNGRGEWVEVPPIPDTLVVNLGEMLQIMTHNYYVATPHRVVNRDPGKTRLSLAYFYNPDLHTRLQHLPLSPELAEAARASSHHKGAGLMASREEMLKGAGGIERSPDRILYGYKYWERWKRSYPDIVRRHYPDEPDQ
jgi:isopenicillin N synthase-like dioxygenase